MANKHFKVTMIEDGPRGLSKIEQECYAPSRADVVKFYGLNEPDIINYSIEEVNQ